MHEQPWPSRWWRGWGATLLLAVLATPARADAPSMPPADHTARSPDGRCVAHAELGRDRVIVSGAAGGAPWIVPGWHRSVLVADGCRTIGVGYDGLSLLREGDLAAETPVLRFFHPDDPGRTVRLGELYPDLAVLPRTVSHRVLYRTTRWDGGAWTVETTDGRILRFAP